VHVAWSLTTKYMTSKIKFTEKKDRLTPSISDYLDGMTIKNILFSIKVVVIVSIVAAVFFLGMFFITSKTLWLILFLFFLAVGEFVIRKGLIDIPASNPPCLGIVTFLGKKTNCVLKEGLHLIAPFAPFFLDIILVNAEKRNMDFCFIVSCKSEEEKVESGGEIEVKGSLTYMVDEKKPVSFISSGGDVGVQNIMKGLMNEYVRIIAIKKTWQEMEFVEEDLGVDFMLKLVDEKNPELQEYYNLTEKEKDDSEKSAPVLKKIFTKGVSDGHNLGIRLLFLNVESVKPQGKLKEEAERLSIEVKQREIETYEADTTTELAQKYIAIGVDPNEALNAAQVQQGKATKVVVSGNANELSKAAAIFSGGKKD